MKELKRFIEEKRAATLITELPKELVEEIQNLLKIEVDGIVGEKTKAAFEDFKKQKNLEYPLVLGVTTAKELIELGEEEEQSVDDKTDIVKSGSFMILPNNTKVFADEQIIKGIPLTWGETTKDCTRVPLTIEHVKNALEVARRFGKVRENFGSPITITSGYRPPQVNSQIGGARNSQHLYFKAIDMIPVNGEFKKLWAVLKDSDFSGLGDGVFMGRNKGFFHADIRPGGRVIFPY